jgi:hypothetical protein
MIILGDISMFNYILEELLDNLWINTEWKLEIETGEIKLT